MSVPFEILLLMSGAGALQSALFSLYLFTLRKSRNLATILLGLLLLAFAIKMLKSVVYYFSEHHQVSTILMNWGFGANLAIYPLLYLYLNSFFDKAYRINGWKHFLHFIPTIIVIVLSPFISDYFWMKQQGYAISLWTAAFYIPVCLRVIYKHYHKINRAQKIWVLSLTLGITVVWVGYFTNYMLGLVNYITGPVSFSFLMYFLTYLSLKRTEVVIPCERYKNSAYTNPQIDDCYTKLQALLIHQQPHRDAAMTLPKMASLLNVTPHLLSETINSRAQQTFPDYINSFRIEQAQRLLQDPAYDNKKITEIAYETGYNSISAFNAAFKKNTHMTPSAFRKANSK
ncbi:helix-turn-helix transcriptional regulator [Dyadobacter sp. CY261]|uniref:helix-turn-helix domain-containing protein n=1 Tax=Dyadobacter sp. CY261 TaxID=2907203 RepID=UPI001F349499|nr:helix-turn-helix transcriptional regulator [Dyadobacter sp. CY261]MCF0075000.1 helix-turn-helix transcriptional regulator [Dyadobacter sp. CY261]